jgi:cytochrome c-type biogenesis protein CcmH
MSLRLRAVLGVLCWVLAGAVAASAEPRQARPMAQDPALEARLLIISEELRCLVCQNESLASSNAELAQDLRNEVRDLMRQGKSDAEVKQFLVQRYGDFVLYRPEFKPLTYFLWVGPFVLLVLGLLVLWRVLRLRRHATVSKRLSPEDRRKAEQLLKDAS